MCAAALLVACGSDDDGGKQASGGAGGSGGAAGSAGTSGSGGTGGGTNIPFCTGSTTLAYSPSAGDLHTFPDDVFTVDDATTKTGLRVKFAAGDNWNAPANSEKLIGVFDDISTLDGFGVTSEAYVQVSGPVDASTLPAIGSAQATDSVLLVPEDSGDPVPIAVTTFPNSATDPKTTIFISPLAPLKPKTRYMLVVTTNVHASDTSCIAPSQDMRDLLSGSATAPALTRLAPRYAAALARLKTLGTIGGPEELTSLTLFTTEHTTEDSATIAASIKTKGAPAYTSKGACDTTPADYVICEGTFPADDFRKNRRGVDEADLTPQASYTLPVVTYLPKTGTGPFPTLIFGHGLGGDRHQAEELAAIAAPRGYATVSIDAVKHGNHPDSGGIIAFFGISLTGTLVDAVKLRDNWRQSTYDKLQLVELMRSGYDADGDGSGDIDFARTSYLGVSLGGIMAAEFLAFAPDMKVALPIVPGARVVNIVKDGEQFAVVLPILSSQVHATDGDIARFFPIVQAVVDRGDSGAYVGHITHDRLPGFDQASPQLLMQMVLNDDTVPNSTNTFFGRGLGVPLLGDELVPMNTVERVTTFPVSANVDASHTAGIFQFDLVYENDTGPGTEPATHGNVAANPVAIEQSFHFIDTWQSGGVAEVIDPYRTLGIKP